MHQMTKILLTAPPDQLEPNNTSREGSAPPLAIYVLASILREHGYSVRIIDPVSHHVGFFDNEVRFPTLEKEINDANVVCISSTSFSWFIARKMIERIKSLVPDIPIIVGGIHATFLDEHVLKNSEVDYVVRGEGEKTLLELLASIENGEGIREVLGISYKDDGKVFRNKDRPSLTIREMEETPLPAFDLMPSGLHELITVESSRGCSFSCAFCSIVYRNLWRGIGTEIFQKRIEHALCYGDKLTGNKGVFLVDDNFTANRSRAEEILGNLSEIDFKDADLSFQARADDLLNSDIIRYCAKIPIKAIGIGAESGYDEAMKKVHKGIFTRDIERCATLLRTYGLSKYAIYSFIVGFPWEGKKDCLRTIDFAYKIVSKYGGLGLINWLYFFPGSDLWNKRHLYGVEGGPEIYDSVNYRCNEFKIKSYKVKEDDIIEIENYCNLLKLLARF